MVTGPRRALGHGALLLRRRPIVRVTLAHVHHLIAEVHAENLTSSFTLTAGNRALWTQRPHRIGIETAISVENVKLCSVLSSDK